jgi:cobalamin-dependent methionine synthase I
VFSERSAVVTDAPNIPEPPFWGVRVVKDYDLREIFHYINDTALFKNQWQLEDGVAGRLRGWWKRNIVRSRRSWKKM